MVSSVIAKAVNRGSLSSNARRCLNTSFGTKFTPMDTPAAAATKTTTTAASPLGSTTTTLGGSTTRAYHGVAGGFNASSRRGTRVSASVSSRAIVRSFASGRKKDYYDLLGVNRSSDKSSIKKAYFKLAKQYHPDTNKDDKTAEAKFKEVTEAYECLSDDKQREMYNQFGHAGVDPNFQEQGGNPFGGGGFNFNDGSFHFQGGQEGQEIDPEELFDMFFGGGGGGRRKPRGPRRGADLQMHARVSFKEAVFGTKKKLHLRYQHQSSSSGTVKMKEREVTVDIPAGIDQGMSIRLQGEGAEGDPGAASGNLLVQVVVDQDDYFLRDGSDVHTEVPISISQAILGGTVDVKTLTGEVEMKIPKGCQPGAKLMLRSKGITHVNSSKKGNHVVHLKLQIPKKITARQEELMREFDEESACHNIGIFGRIAHASETAFEKMFGGKHKLKKQETKEQPKKKEVDSDDEDEKKAAPG